jgi:hypothetical protein
MSGRVGHVYVLSNPALPGMVKIGHTLKAEAEMRAIELSASTSIPLPFVLEDSWLVEDPLQAETDIHRALSALRVSRGREFFRMDVPSAVAHINEHLYGTDTFPDLLLRQFEELQRLLAKYPKAFRNADGAVWQMDEAIALLRAEIDRSP